MTEITGKKISDEKNLEVFRHFLPKVLKNYEVFRHFFLDFFL